MALFVGFFNFSTTFATYLILSRYGFNLCRICTYFWEEIRRLGGQVFVVVYTQDTQSLIYHL